MLFQQNSQKRINVPPTRDSQAGVVIVVALFIVALVATMAYTMMARIERDTLRTSLILRDTQAELYAQGSIAWAMDQLRNNWKNQKPNQLVDVTPIKSQVLSEKGYRIASTIYDMQARYNINMLITPEAQLDFRRMLQAITPSLTEQEAQRIVSGIGDRVIKRPLFSVSELRFVKGMNANIFNTLRDHVVALPPEVITISIQNASAPVIITLGDSMTLEAAKVAVKELHEKMPLAAIEDFLNLDVVKNHGVSEKKITLISQYFLVKTEVTIEKQHIVLYTLLERITNKHKPIVNVLWQSKGVW